MPTLLSLDLTTYTTHKHANLNKATTKSTLIHFPVEHKLSSSLISLGEEGQTGRDRPQARGGAQAHGGSLQG